MSDGNKRTQGFVAAEKSTESKYKLLQLTHELDMSRKLIAGS